LNKKPGAIVRCVDVADVMACVNHARANGILLAVRGGRHNGPGLGSCDGGLVIDSAFTPQLAVKRARRIGVEIDGVHTARQLFTLGAGKPPW
jgi:FAD/FMN-containing dehydrogenase